MADFSTTLAQMIAGARPEFKAQQGHTQVIPGPQGYAGTARAKETNLGVQIPSMKQIQSIFGIESDETQRSLAEAAYQTFNFLNTTMKPEELEAITGTPDYQSKMARWHKAGHPSILEVPDTNTGTVRYKWVPGAPNKDAFNAAMETVMRQTDPEGWKRMKGAGPTEPQIAAGQAGEPARQTYMSTQREVAESTYGAKAKAEMMYTHPSIVKLREAEAKNQEAAAALHGTQAIEIGTKLPVEMKRIEAETRRLDAEAQRAIDRSDNEIAKAGAIEANKAFDDFYKAFIIKNSNLPDDEMSNFSRNTELGANVLSHVSAMKYYLGSGEAAKRSIVRWFSAVDKEFDRKTNMSTRFMIGGPTSAAETQLARRRQYYKMALDIVREAGGMDASMREKIYKWGRLMGYTDDIIKKELQSALSGTAAPAPAAPPAQAPQVEIPPSVLAPGRAEGGPVQGGKPYVVGEKGAELFVPEQSGNIVPNQSGGSLKVEGMSDDFSKREHVLMSALLRDIDLLDRVIEHAQKMDPMKPISPEMLEQRQSLQDMYAKQQERVMRLRDKAAAAAQKKKEKSNGSSE